VIVGPTHLLDLRFEHRSGPGRDAVDVIAQRLALDTDGPDADVRRGEAIHVDVGMLADRVENCGRSPVVDEYGDWHRPQ
jgi:hypothetical protein